ncbi:MAG TPA: elongation factor P [Actinomycetota bacterium]|nr:elongation factor P [Actinomycetota bacterium]
MSVSTNDLKNGMTLNLGGDLWTVLQFLHHKPGKGQAVVRTKLRNVKTGSVQERTFKADEKVGLAIVDRREMQYLYREGDHLVLMDNQTYEQTHVPLDVVGEAASYLVEGATALVPTYEGVPIGVELPAAVVLRVTTTEPGVKGDRVSGAMKPATLETGITVQVPLFVEEGDRVKVDTRSGQYLSREQ